MDVFFLQPGFSSRTVALEDALQLVIFVMVALVVSSLNKERLARVKASRQPDAVAAALDQVRTVAAGSGNLLYPIREALSVSATLGEICDVLREVFGVYQPRESF